MDAGWRPGNDVEGELKAALEAADGVQYGELVRTSTLYLPTLADGTPAEWPEDLPEMDAEHVLAFTSPMTLFHGLAGYVRGYEEVTFDQIRQRWPNPDTNLLVNVGSPISVALTIRQLDDLADGKETLVPVEDIQDAVVDGMMSEVRRLCLADLGGDVEVANMALTEVEPNALEARLETAVDNADFDDFLLGLLRSNVVVLTTEAVSDPARIVRHGFPWRIVDGGDAPVVPVFSSSAVLDHIVPGAPHRVEVPFLDLLAGWPSDEHVLCFNPGTTTELTLPGGGMPELAAIVTEVTADGLG